MPMLERPLPIIRPITDLRTKLNDVCDQAVSNQEPIVLTKNGTPAFVLMDSETYEARIESTRVRAALVEAEIEEKYRPETVSSRDADDRMRKLFEIWGLTYA